jgi:hypothetical protein
VIVVAVVNPDTGVGVATGVFTPVGRWIPFPT